MNMQPDPKVVMKFTQVALAVLSAKFLVWTTMFITAAMFAYALYLPDAMRFGVAVAFALLVFWRVTWSEKQQPPQGENHE